MNNLGRKDFIQSVAEKGSTGRPSSKQLSSADKLKKAEARIAFLEAELEFLKKLDELERQALQKKRF